MDQLVLIYDVSAEPVAWSAFAASWILGAIFIYTSARLIPATADPTYDQNRWVPRILPIVILVALVVYSVSGLLRRHSCQLSAASPPEMTSGIVSDTFRSPKSGKLFEFSVGGRHFQQSGVFQTCALTRSLDEVVRIDNGQRLQVAHDSYLILKAWRANGP